MSEELDELRARIRALLGSEVTIFVGGATEQEKRTLQYLLDDAALAVAAAKRSGVVEGLGLTVQRVLANDNDAVHDAVRAKLAERVRLSELDVAELADAVLDAVGLAYMSSTCRVLTNSRLEAADILHRCLRENKTFNAVTREYTPVDKAQVINPADTDIEVLRGAMSIVGLFISSDQTLLTRPTAGGGLD
jgi:chaperonin GroEL (HSP60 family)